MGSARSAVGRDPDESSVVYHGRWEEAALVDSRETAEQVIQNIVTSCGHEGAEVLDVELKEETTTKRMDLELGDDPPDVMTAAEAEKKLLGTHKEESILTVVTTEERKEEEDIDIPEEYQPVKSLSVGRSRWLRRKPGDKGNHEKGDEGNGNPVSETILEESVVEEPEEKVILAGTKLPASYQSSFMRIRIFRMMKTPYTGSCSVLSPAGSLRPALVRAGAKCIMG